MDVCVLLCPLSDGCCSCCCGEDRRELSNSPLALGIKKQQELKELRVEVKELQRKTGETRREQRSSSVASSQGQPAILSNRMLLFVSLLESNVF